MITSMKWHRKVQWTAEKVVGLYLLFNDPIILQDAKELHTLWKAHKHKYRLPVKTTFGGKIFTQRTAQILQFS